ncbi:hypothetical protein IF2G_03456 [Cordyceps javanica]|nr:hypothetical protein IF2G_03456 [Cordyceps javanica]
MRTYCNYSLDTAEFGACGGCSTDFSACPPTLMRMHQDGRSHECRAVDIPLERTLRRPGTSRWIEQRYSCL